LRCLPSGANSLFFPFTPQAFPCSAVAFLFPPFSKPNKWLSTRSATFPPSFIRFPLWSGLLRPAGSCRKKTVILFLFDTRAVPRPFFFVFPPDINILLSSLPPSLCLFFLPCRLISFLRVLVIFHSEVVVLSEGTGFPGEEELFFFFLPLEPRLEGRTHFLIY